MEEKLKKFLPLFILAGIVFVAAGIYITVNHVGMATRNDTGSEASFWLGLWQGMIIFLSFVASWFDHNIVLYQVNNDGFWYNFGYFLGVAIALGGGARGTKGTKNIKKIEIETVTVSE